MTVHLRYRIVDVFSDRPLAGNALCVVTDPAPDPVMQAIAREVNLSETTFPIVPGAGVPEDPGTGSAAGPIGVLCRQRWGTADDVTIRQGDEMGRACRIDVHAGSDGVKVGGRVAACAEGGFTLG
jgi:predicted PhzF superfamily epimerase YddE/YHI9